MELKKERTEKQIEASRLNGAKSRGPVTPMGKRRSSRNALRHGRLVCSLTLTLEDESQFRQILRDLCRDHNPVGFTEHSLVETMAVAKWEQRRALCAAHVAIDKQVAKELENPQDYKHHGASAVSDGYTRLLDERGCLTPMHTERSRCQRDYERALNMLYKAQDRRERKGGPGANLDIAPIVSESDNPAEVVEDTEPTEEIGFMGLLPDTENEEIFTENPAISLKTIDTSRVRFPEPEPVHAAPAALSEVTATNTETPVTEPRAQASGLSLVPRPAALTTAT